MNRSALKEESTGKPGVTTFVFPLPGTPGAASSPSTSSSLPPSSYSILAPPFLRFLATLGIANLA
jgi:hypothetical protein